MPPRSPGFRRFALASALVAALAACAHYSIQKDGEGSGYDVFRPEPYLLMVVRKDTTNVKLIWLPNYEHRYRVHSSAGLGKADVQLNFENGWMLTSLTDKSDNTALLQSLTGLIEKMAPGFAGAETVPGGMQLYRIKFDDGHATALELLEVSDSSDKD